MSRHSPAPWRLTENMRVRDALGNHVAVLPEHHNTSANSNGLVITAAPELLKALSNLVRANKIAVDGSMARRIAIQLAEESIAKARGEE